MALLMSVCFTCFVCAEETTGAMSHLNEFLDILESFLNAAAWIVVLVGGIVLILGFISHDNQQKINGVITMACSFLFMAVIDWVFTNI